MRIYLFVLAIVTALLLLPPKATCAQGNDGANPTDETWEVTRELLLRREYGMAIYFLEGLVDDPAHAESAENIQSDINVISELQKLSDAVETGIKSLKENDAFTDRNNKYLFQRFEENDEGNSLLVKAVTSQEQNLKWRQLHSATWLNLASRDENLVASNCTVGIFLAFDRDADRDTALAKLDEAAESGQDVKIWLERVNGMVSRTTPEQAKQSSSESLIGNWFVSFGKRKMAFVMECYENGRGNIFIEKWEKEDDGYYRIAIARRGTASVIVIGDRLFGRLSSGEMIKGTR